MEKGSEPAIEVLRAPPAFVEISERGSVAMTNAIISGGKNPCDSGGLERLTDAGLGSSCR
jgi:hypothetical protein